MKRFISLMLAVVMCLCAALSFSSCKKEKASSGADAASPAKNEAQADDKQDTLTTGEDFSEIATTEAEIVKQEDKTDQDSKNNTTVPGQSKTTQKTASQSKTTKAVSNDPKPASQDFKTLENILNWDGGEIEHADSNYFNYKTASAKRFIEVANSYGFVPAYRAYIDKNMFSNSDKRDIDNDGYEDISVSLKGFNWVLKNVYNYNGAEISSSNPCGCNIRGDKIYFWIPPDEGGVYGEFRFKNYTVKDNVYKVKFDYYDNIGEYGEEPEYVFDSVYTVTAVFKSVRNANDTADINVWSIYSISK